MEERLISIIIPTYNRADLLLETLGSFRNQIYSNWECIVVDDGSTDNTEQLVNEYTSKDARFQYHKRPVNRPKGANACRNYGFEVSKGEFVNWFDSDDLVAIDFLEIKSNILKEDPNLDVAACYGEQFFEDERPNHPVCPVDDYTDNEVENYVLHDFCFYTPSPLWRRSSLIEKDEWFDENLHRGQEKDFHFRMVVKGIRYKRFKEKPLFFIRMDNERITTKASVSIRSKQSVFDFRDKQFQILKSIENPSKNKLNEYLFYRQAALYYDMIQTANAEEGTEVYKHYFPKLKAMIAESHIDSSFGKKIRFGNWMLKLFKKGYKFFYFKQFDYRSF